jgi:hypothetical protein
MTRVNGVYVEAGDTDKEVNVAGFLLYRFKSALRTLYSHYNDLVSHYNLPLDKMPTLPSRTLFS